MSMAVELATVLAWLTHKVRKQVAANILGAVGAAFSSLLVLGITFAITYLVLLVAFRWAIPLHANQTRLWVCLGVLGFLFVANAFTNREELGEYSVSTFDNRPPVSFYLPSGGLVTNVNFMAPDTLQSLARMLIDIGCSGPRLTVLSWTCLQKAGQLKRLDLDGCAGVLTVLLNFGRKASFQSIYEACNWIDPVVVFPQLLLLDGVVLLPSEPAGLSLTDELRKQFRDETASPSPTTTDAGSDEA